MRGLRDLKPGQLDLPFSGDQHRCGPKVAVNDPFCVHVGQRGREIFGDSVTQAWLPWDYGFAVRRFLARAAPSFGVLLETEIWPNLLAACKAGACPCSS